MSSSLCYRKPPHDASNVKRPVKPYERDSVSLIFNHFVYINFKAIFYIFTVRSFPHFSKSQIVLNTIKAKQNILVKNYIGMTAYV